MGTILEQAGQCLVVTVCSAVTLLGCRQLERNESTASPSAAPPPPSAQSPILALGDTAELPTYRIKVVSQRDCSLSPTSSTKSEFRNLGIELEVTNSSNFALATSPFYATIVDDQRFKYTTSLTQCAPLLPAKLLAPKETVRGFVPYELPRNTRTALLEYHPILPGNASYVARFRLEF